MDRPVNSASCNRQEIVDHIPRFPTPRRMALAALTGSTLLSGIYIAFPPIFPRSVAEEAVTQAPAQARMFQELPDVPMTPAITAHRRSIALLEEGLRRLEDVSTYTADFSKKEVVGGVATVPQSMRLKMRHEPFSVYLRWVEGKPGQELLYAEGQHEEKMIVRAGGLKGIFGPIKLDIDGAMAKQEARHPITEMGLKNLSEGILEYRYREAAWKSGYDCYEEPSTIDGRRCCKFTLVYDSPKLSPEYRKSEIWIDDELKVVTRICNYGWPEPGVAEAEIDEQTMLEDYSYSNINLSSGLIANDFDAGNSDYRLRRR